MTKLKYIFKISADKPVQSVLQIIAILVLILFLVIVCIYSFISIFCPDTGKCDYKTEYRHAISMANQEIMIEEKINGKINYDSAENIAKIFIEHRKGNINKVYNIQTKYFDTSKKGLPKEYQNMPAWIDNENRIFVITKFEQGCKIVNQENVLDSSCIIEFDYNGKQKPNTIHQDRFQLIIDGNKNHVLPTTKDWEEILNKHNK